MVENKVNKGKSGKYCPFRVGHKCGDFCGLFCIGLNSCVFHAINKNLMDMKNSHKEDLRDVLNGNK